MKTLLIIAAFIVIIIWGIGGALVAAGYYAATVAPLGYSDIPASFIGASMLLVWPVAYILADYTASAE